MPKIPQTTEEYIEQLVGQNYSTSESTPDWEWKQPPAPKNFSDIKQKVHDYLRSTQDFSGMSQRMKDRLSSASPGIEAFIDQGGTMPDPDVTPMDQWDRMKVAAEGEGAPTPETPPEAVAQMVDDSYEDVGSREPASKDGGKFKERSAKEVLFEENEDEVKDPDELMLEEAMAKRDVSSLINSMGEAFDQINRGLAGVKNDNDRAYWAARQKDAQDRYKSVIDHITGKTTRSAKKLALESAKLTMEQKREKHDKNNPLAKLAIKQLHSIGYEGPIPKPGDASLADLEENLGVKMADIFSSKKPEVKAEMHRYRFSITEKARESLVKTADKMNATESAVMYKDVEDTFQQLRNLPPGDTGRGIIQHQLVIAAFKLEDPKSAVLMSEATSAEDKAGLMSKWGPMLMAKIKNGLVLTEDQERAIMNRAGLKYENRMELMQHEIDAAIPAIIKQKRVAGLSNYSKEEAIVELKMGGMFNAYRENYLNKNKVKEGDEIFDAGAFEFDPDSIQTNKHKGRKPSSQGETFRIKGREGRYRKGMVNGVPGNILVE